MNKWTNDVNWLKTASWRRKTIYETLTSSCVFPLSGSANISEGMMAA